jgi:uncharacterized membrane protein YjgN (DUF898 family)
MLTADQGEFFRFFAIAAPAGMTAEGAARFMDAYLRDPERQARWQKHLRARGGAAPAAVPAARVAAPVASRPLAPPAAAPVAGSGSPLPLEFTGAGSEYARIWIVNLLLTILTLGIYSAWAKVRRLQYFYRHTELAGASFDYHGTPMAILKGRLIALGLFLAYSFSFAISDLLGFATLALLAAAIPWLLRGSFRFRMRNSSYRGLRFRFAGSMAGAYETFLWRPIVVMLTVNLATPWFHQRLKQYQHGNALFGTTPFAFHATVGQFYREYLVVGLLMALALALPFGLLFAAMAELARTAQETGAQPDPQLMAGAMVTFVFGFLAATLLITPIWQARMQNVVWNGTTLGAHRFASVASAWRLFGIHLTNALGIVLTLGLFMPWAAVRVARYRASTVTLQPSGSLEQFVAAQGQDVAAAGEETADLFDIDIAL